MFFSTPILRDLEFFKYLPFNTLPNFREAIKHEIDTSDIDAKLWNSKWYRYIYGSIEEYEDISKDSYELKRPIISFRQSICIEHLFCINLLLTCSKEYDIKDIWLEIDNLRDLKDLKNVFMRGKEIMLHSEGFWTGDTYIQPLELSFIGPYISTNMHIFGTPKLKNRTIRCRANAIIDK